MNVWIVYEYDYGDSAIRGVFDSLEKAEQEVTDQMKHAAEKKYTLHLEIQTWEIR